MSRPDQKKKYLTHAQVALVFAVEPRTVTKWVNDLGMPKVGRGEYDLVQCVQWRCNYLEKKIREAEAGGAEGLSAKHRINIATARKKENELALQERSLVNIEEVMPVIDKTLDIFRMKALTFSKRVAPALEGMESNAEREAILKENIHELLNDLTTIPDKLRSSVELDQADEDVVRTAHPAAKNDGKRVGRRKANTQRRNRQRAR
ncbi:MAG: hypothetical protein ACYC09_14800 [Bacteroidota bacterium]